MERAEVRSILGPDVRSFDVLAPFVRTDVLPAVNTRFAARVASHCVAPTQVETLSELPSSPGYLAMNSPTLEMPEE